MLGLMRKVTWDVLEQLERELHARKDLVWATYFCVISILCISIEDAQIAIDGFVMHTKFHGTNISSYGDRIQACRKLDDQLFTHLNDLFHGVFRTEKRPSTRRKGNIYNPIRDGSGDTSSLDQSSVSLINNIRRVIADEGKYLLIRLPLDLIVHSHLYDEIGRNTISRQ